MKDSPEIKPQFIHDAAYQAWVLDKCGVLLDGVYVVYHYDDDVDPFEPVDVTEEAIEANRQVYMQRPGWENLTAVKENKVYVIPHPIHREVFDCSSIQAVAKIMWPEAFSDLDPVKTYQEFWDRFMPFTLSGVWYYGF